MEDEWKFQNSYLELNMQIMYGMFEAVQFSIAKSGVSPSIHQLEQMTLFFVLTKVLL